MKEYLLVPDMMRLLSCSRPTLYREIAAGRLPKPFKLTSNKAAWHRDDVIYLIEQRRQAAKEGQ